MNPFDAPIITFVNGFAQRSWTFDAIIVFLSGSVLLKGGVIFPLLW